MHQLTDNVYRNIRLRGKHAEVGSHHSFHGPADNQLQRDPCSGASLHMVFPTPLAVFLYTPCVIVHHLLARGISYVCLLEWLGCNPLLSAYTGTLAVCRV